MTAADRFTVLIAAMTLCFSALSFIALTLVRLTRRWTQVEDNLQAMTDKVGRLVLDKMEDHVTLSRQIEKIDSRIERHEVWHDDHPYLRT